MIEHSSVVIINLMLFASSFSSGNCKIESIDGVEFLEPSETLFEVAKNALDQHYANPNTWTDMEAES